LEEFYTRDAVFDLTRVAGWPESPVYEGHDGLRRFWQEWFSMWEQVTWELERLEPVGDSILSVAVQRGIGASSHTPAEWRLTFLSTFRGSKVLRARFFSSPEAALEAA
jgi:hypothetical protein